MKRTIFYLLLLMITGQTWAGGGWTNKKGNGFFSLSQSMIYGNFYFNQDAQVISSPSLGVFTTNLYGEYGITDRFTGILYSPFLTSVNRQGGIDSTGQVFNPDQAIGLGDLDIGIKYGWVQGSVNIATSVIFGLPTGNHFAGETGTLHLGDGEFNQLIKLDVSAGLNNGLFTTVFGGFNNRTNGFSDEIHVGGELGYSRNKWIAIVKIYGRYSVFNETPRKDSPIPGIYSDNIEYLAISPQVLYRLKNNWGVMGEIGFAAHGRNIIASPAFQLGVFYELK
jgi:hypothetical protein